VRETHGLQGAVLLLGCVRVWKTLTLMARMAMALYQARAYCGGAWISAPSSLAARRGQ
jgi:hypothetical protein